MFPTTEENMQLPLGKNLAERLKCFCFSITVVKRGNRLRAVTPFSFVFRRDVNETPGGRPYKEDRGARRNLEKNPQEVLLAIISFKSTVRPRWSRAKIVAAHSVYCLKLSSLRLTHTLREIFEKERICS